MGPMHELVRLAERRGLHPFLETLVCSKRAPLVALHVESNGAIRAEPMEHGAKAVGLRAWSRTGSQPAPRAFRDDAKNTLDLGKHRDQYTQIVGAMVQAHPRSAPLQAFHAFLASKRTLSVRKRVEGAQYIPLYNGKPIVRSVVHDYDDVFTDPYGPPSSDRQQIDIITGERCTPSTRRPIRIRGFGSSTGTTLISIDDPVTSSHWMRDPHLQVPMSERTLHMHVAGLQSLIDETEDGPDGQPWRRWAVAARRGDDKLGYFAWCDTLDGPEAMVLSVLKGRAVLEDVEQWADDCAEIDTNLCVLGLTGTRRLVIYGWSCLPLAEAAQNVRAYARMAVADPHRRVPGVTGIAALTMPHDVCCDESGIYSHKRARELANAHLDWQSHAALVDHIVDGQPFPLLTINRLRTAFLSQDHQPRMSFHAREQVAILEGIA